eukprot:g22740.t1
MSRSQKDVLVLLKKSSGQATRALEHTMFQWEVLLVLFILLGGCVAYKLYRKMRIQQDPSPSASLPTYKRYVGAIEDLTAEDDMPKTPVVPSPKSVPCGDLSAAHSIIACKLCYNLGIAKASLGPEVNSASDSLKPKPTAPASCPSWPETGLLSSYLPQIKLHLDEDHRQNQKEEDSTNTQHQHEQLDHANTNIASNTGIFQAVALALDIVEDVELHMLENETKDATFHFSTHIQEEDLPSPKGALPVFFRSLHDKHPSRSSHAHSHNSHSHSGDRDRPHRSHSHSGDRSHNSHVHNVDIPSRSTSRSRGNSRNGLYGDDPSSQSRLAHLNHVDGDKTPDSQETIEEGDFKPNTELSSSGSNDTHHIDIAEDVRVGFGANASAAANPSNAPDHTVVRKPLYLEMGQLSLEMGQKDQGREVHLDMGHGASAFAGASPRPSGSLSNFDLIEKLTSDLGLPHQESPTLPARSILHEKMLGMPNGRSDSLPSLFGDRDRSMDSVATSLSVSPFSRMRFFEQQNDSSRGNLSSLRVFPDDASEPGSLPNPRLLPSDSAQPSLTSLPNLRPLTNDSPQPSLSNLPNLRLLPTESSQGSLPNIRLSECRQNYSPSPPIGAKPEDISVETFLSGHFRRHLTLPQRSESNTTRPHVPIHYRLPNNSNQEPGGRGRPFVKPIPATRARSAGSSRRGEHGRAFVKPIPATRTRSSG